MTNVSTNTDTGSRIEQAALALFSQYGYAGSSIREITASANVATATMFHHYPTKQAILKAILNRAADELYTDLKSALEGKTDPVDRFMTALRVLVVAHCARRAQSFVAQSELRWLDPSDARAVRAKRIKIQRIFDAAVEEGVASGAFNSASPHEASRAILNMGTMVAVWYQDNGTHTPQALADIYCDLAGRMLGIAGT